MVAHRRTGSAEDLGGLGDDLLGPRPAVQRRLGLGGAQRRRRDPAQADLDVGDVSGRPAAGANATATLEMSSNRRLAILWKAVIGATGVGIRTVLISSPGPLDGLPVAGEVVGQRAPRARRHSRPGPASSPGPAAPAGCRRSASRCRGCRRASRRCGSAGRRTAGTARPAAGRCRPASRSISDSVSAAPMSMASSVTVEARAAPPAGRCRW